MARKENISNITNSQVNIGGNYIVGDQQASTGGDQQKSNSKSNPKKESGVLELITKSKIKEALEQLVTITGGVDDDLHTRSLLLMERWNRLGQQQKLGALSLEDIDIAQNRIAEQLIQMSKELKRSDQA